MAVVLERRSLKELLEDTERKTRDTGFYAGVRDLVLRNQNPFRWEEALSKLVASTGV